jgi:hypothetical protein
MAAVEKVFVILTASNAYYFVPNLDRAVLARHLNERVRITGEVSAKYNAINATKIDAFRGGAWKTTWTWAMQVDVEKSLMAVE